MCSFVSRFKTGLAKILSYKSFSLHVSELQWHFSDKKLLKTNKQTLYQLNLLQSEQSIIKSISCSRVFVINKSPTLWTIDFSHVHMYFRFSCFWALPIWDTYLLILSRPRQHISTKYIDMCLRHQQHNSWMMKYCAQDTCIFHTDASVHFQYWKPILSYSTDQGNIDCHQDF